MTLDPDLDSAMSDLALALHYLEIAMVPPIDEEYTGILNAKIDTITTRISRIQERLLAQERGLA